jgi:hypothetical protein
VATLCYQLTQAMTAANQLGSVLVTVDDPAAGSVTTIEGARGSVRHTQLRDVCGGLSVRQRPRQREDRTQYVDSP